jgi:hypothetical protein
LEVFINIHVVTEYSVKVSQQPTSKQHHFPSQTNCLFLPAHPVLPAQGQLLFLSKEQETTNMQKLLLTKEEAIVSPCNYSKQCGQRRGVAEEGTTMVEGNAVVKAASSDVIKEVVASEDGSKFKWKKV